MKKVFILLLFSLFLTSCEKDYLVPNKEVPQWLKDRIAKDQKDTNSFSDISAWIRYEYNGKYYYEYNLMTSSQFPPVFTDDGQLLSQTKDSYIDYMNNKCCKKYIWKGKTYSLD